MENQKSVQLSVNINKLATLRNARGGQNPDILEYTRKIESYGAHGITIHPRPDQRHIRLDDVGRLKAIVQTEFNIEGYPSADFLKLVLEIKPEQVTLVPDPPDVLTSNAGWNTLEKAAFLKPIIQELKDAGIRSSIFLNPEPHLVEAAAEIGCDRIELYTESYAVNFHRHPEQAVQPYIDTAQEAIRCGLGINAGHDLDLKNLKYFKSQVPGLLEVSIGHALICDALEFGMANTVKMYLACLR